MKVTTLRTEEVETMPEQASMLDGVLYLSRKFALAIHLCACGCRIQTVTPLSCEDLPDGWRLTETAHGATLHPSIGNQQFPCGSHYWVQNGAVVPC